MKHTDKYAKVKELIKTIFNRNKGRYGYRRVLSSIQRQKLMKELGLPGRCKKNKYRSYKGDAGKIAPNIMNRQFKTNKPYEKLVTDVTELKLCDEKGYLSPVMDLHNQEIAAYSIRRRPSFAQTKEMLNRLFNKLPLSATPLLHSDQGWQYQMKEYLVLLKEHNITQSISRKGNGLDNSAMENFFGRLKTEMFFGETFSSLTIFNRNLKNAFAISTIEEYL